MSRLDDLAHELWYTAQLLPGECISDGVERIKDVIREFAGKDGFAAEPLREIRTPTVMGVETEYLTPRQFARLVGVSESTLAKQRMRGDGPPYVKIGRRVCYSRNAGLAWVGEHTRRSTSDAAVDDRPRKRGNAACSQ